MRPPGDRAPSLQSRCFNALLRQLPFKQHLASAEAVQAHRDLGARQSVAMHWGTWQLTDEGRDEQPRALAEARAAAGLASNDFRVMAPGENLLV